MDNALLSVSHLNVRLQGHLILDDLTFSVRRGEVLAIIGPNGAGKTVLFRTLLGLLPYGGEIRWKEGLVVGYVPQKLSIDQELPLTTAEFFSFKIADQAEINRTLEAVGFSDQRTHPGHLVSHILGQKLGRLSGGELQRVLIAWALIGHPDVLLFDEPTAGVDVSAEESIYGLLHHIHEREREHLTTILISHELQVVYRYATTVMCLNKEKVCFGPPFEVLDRGNLMKLYGGDVGMYEHHHHHHHGE